MCRVVCTAVPTELIEVYANFKIFSSIKYRYIYVQLFAKFSQACVTANVCGLALLECRHSLGSCFHCWWGGFSLVDLKLHREQTYSQKRCIYYDGGEYCNKMMGQTTSDMSSMNFISCLRSHYII